ncbi:MAG: glycosyltransferase family 4 protein [Chroococcidiopsidaceae cyanobacterium CP_BM_ER_R8_30]|nr:glycosyltransferase family 4 protein [Chroococcidiopsidaceae cyanobacterium CP_BM_ER_R8_30]
MKVLCLFDYSVAERNWNRWKNKEERESPEHHLWGITHLHKYGIDVEVLPYEKYVVIKKIGKKFKLGDLEQQLRVIFNLSQYDLLYSTCQTSTILLSLLRILGILPKPIVVKLERPFKNGLFSKMLLRLFAKGHDKLLCLSSRVEDQLKNEFGISEKKLALLNWGPDLPSYEREKNDINSSETAFIMSAGNMSRDYNTLAKAFSEISFQLRIYCSEASAPTTSLTPNVKVQYKHPIMPSALSWKELVAEYERAYAIAIPLYIPQNRVNTTPLYGLTSLLDAMAMGKATIMTKHRQVNIDIEKEGIGIWVEAGDVKGWEEAIDFLLEHPNETQKMGKRARHLCEVKYNLEIFSSQLAKELSSVLL